MTRLEAIGRVLKLRALAAGGAAVAEADTARKIADELAREHTLTDAELAEAREIDEAIRAGAEPSSYEPAGGPPRRSPSELARADHVKHPFRVHMAVDSNTAVCGVRANEPRGRALVWTYTRTIAIESGVACPHCLATGLIDARKPERIARARDARGRFIAGPRT